MKQKEIRFGIIGCGLMGREFASAVQRWCNLTTLNVKPRIVGVSSASENSMEWFRDHFPEITTFTTDYRNLLDRSDIDVIYCAVPHHLHESIYIDILSAGKHLFGEKPFGIDIHANIKIMKAISDHPNLFVRVSSEFPFFPGALKIYQWIVENRFEQIIDVEAGFWHSSDLNPLKPINWKRKVEFNGEYGSMGDLGMHVVHLPFRCGWFPFQVYALLKKVFTERPDNNGTMTPCDTWDNAILSCKVQKEGYDFPMVLSMKRVSPGDGNTWFIRIKGTRLSAEFSTKNPKIIRYLEYTPGGRQSWQCEDLAHVSVYPVITGGIFEFGFADAFLQMIAAYCDEFSNGRDKGNKFYCATPEEAYQSHVLFTAALQSHKDRNAVDLVLS